MPLDLGQYLRNSISIDRYEAMRSAAPAQAEKAAAPEQTGMVMGSEFYVEEDPIAELMDSMEELSFQFEDTEAKNVSQRKLGQNRGIGDRFLQAMEKWAKAMPDMPSGQLTSTILDMLRKAKQTGQLPNASGFLARLAEESDEPAHQFAMLDILEQALEAQDTELRSLVESARNLLLSEKEPEIRVAINLAQEVNARATTPEEMQELRDMYRGEVLGFSTPQQCFRSIMETRGAAGLQAAIDFLTAGAGADIQSATPSKSPEELRRIILDLQCVQVLKTVLDRMNGLEGRMARQFGEMCKMNGEQMTGKIMDFTEFSFVGDGEIGSFIASCGIEKLLARMDFCRELTSVFRQLSSRLFSNEQDRIRLIDAAQEHLDGIISEEYDQEEADEEDDADAGKGKSKGRSMEGRS